MITEFIVSAGERIKRVDVFLVSHERGISRSRVQRLISTGRVRINAAVVKPSQKVKPGDRISLDKPEPGLLMVNEEPVPLDVLHEDEILLVVNKPAGVVVHPTSGNWKGTLLNGLLSHFQSQDKAHALNHSNIHLGLVHRLDKDTSGVMVVAKTDQAHRVLCLQFEKQSITRTYEALVHGRPTVDKGTIDVPIGRDAIDGKKVSTRTSKPQRAVTEFKVIQQFGDMASCVELTPRTGRQHQLRVHMDFLGCPILGDPIYGPFQQSGTSFPRMMLHATKLMFQHPTTKVFQEFLAVLPYDIESIHHALKKKSFG